MIGYKLVHCNGTPLQPYDVYFDDKIGEVVSVPYELDKEYEYREEPILRYKGFHFCSEIWCTFLYLDMSYFRTNNFKIFIIDTLDGQIKSSLHECVTNKFKVIDEVSIDKIKDNLEENWKEAFQYYFLRYVAAHYCVKSDILVGDKERSIRNEIAKYETDEEILKCLIHDESRYIRQALVERGYFLDEFLNDDSYYIRNALVQRRYKLDELIKCDSYLTKINIAKIGYGALYFLKNKEFGLLKIALRNKFKKGGN